jgi:hypothetical protein
MQELALNDEDRLREFAGDTLQYEYKMLASTERRFAQALEAGDEELANIILESFLLHVRNLTEFYRKDKSAHASAGRYLDTHEQKRAWRNARKATVKLVTDGTFNLVSEWLSHPSLGRSGTKPGWDVKALRDELFALFKAFYRILPMEKRAWFAWAEAKPKVSVIRFDPAPVYAVSETTMTTTTLSATILSVHLGGLTD